MDFGSSQTQKFSVLDLSEPPMSGLFTSNSRAWLITIFAIGNDEEGDGVRKAIESLRENPLVKTFCFCEETCPSTGRHHYQGFCQFTYNWRRSRVSSLFPCSVDLRPADDNIVAMRAYCLKTKEQAAHRQFEVVGGYVARYGDESVARNKRGARNDLNDVRDDILSGKSIVDIVRTTTSMPALNFARIALPMLQSHRTAPPIVKWFWGGTGTGKSATAHAESLEAAGGKLDDIWWGRNLNGFMEGYWGQRFVVIDEFRSQTCTLDLFLQLCDRYPLRVPVKGSSCVWRATHVWCTSPYTPSSVFSSSGEDLAQVHRRISVIREFTSRDAAALVFPVAGGEVDGGEDVSPAVAADIAPIVESFSIRAGVLVGAAACSPSGGEPAIVVADADVVGDGVFSPLYDERGALSPHGVGSAVYHACRCESGCGCGDGKRECSSSDGISFSPIEFRQPDFLAGYDDDVDWDAMDASLLVDAENEDDECAP